MTETASKAAFAWASIAGADPEPAEVIVRQGRKGILTIGCPDPFWLDDEAAGVRLHYKELDRPFEFLTEAERSKLQQAYEQSRRSGSIHSWRGPR